MKRNLAMLGIAAVLVILILCFSDIQSVDEYYLMHMEDITEDSETVTISIVCNTLLEEGNWNKLDNQLQSTKYVPEDGMILKETTYVLRSGDTVYDILNRVCRYNKIQMEYVGSADTAYSATYIRGINYLYEFSCGPLSGWMYRVNGEYPGVGCADYELKDNDRIEWIYSCELGRDVGDTYESEPEDSVDESYGNISDGR